MTVLAVNESWLKLSPISTYIDIKIIVFQSAYMIPKRRAQTIFWLGR